MAFHSHFLPVLLLSTLLLLLLHPSVALSPEEALHESAIFSEEDVTMHFADLEDFHVGTTPAASLSSSSAVAVQQQESEILPLSRKEFGFANPSYSSSSSSSSSSHSSPDDGEEELADALHRFLGAEDFSGAVTSDSPSDRSSGQLQAATIRGAELSSAARNAVAAVQSAGRKLLKGMLAQLQ